MSAPDRQSESHNTGEVSSLGVNLGKASSNINTQLGLKPGEVFTYSHGVTDSFRKRYEDFLGRSSQDLAERLSNSTLGEHAARPFYSEREGNTVTVVIPLTMARGDILAELICLLCSHLPTVILVEGTKGWSEPSWTATASRHLLGITAALQGPPSSFAGSSSPVDLTKIAVWIEACLVALSKPGGVRDAYGAVVPVSMAGTASARKYLSKCFATLRGCSADEDVSSALLTLENLLKIWCRTREEEALSLVRRQSISWSALLNKCAPMEKKRIKGVDTRILKPPGKPSKSPWLSQAERGHISHLVSPIWANPDEIRKEWVRLKPEEQHTQFNSYCARLRASYERMNSISQSMHAKIGHRKRWVIQAVEAAGTSPRGKKEKDDPFRWSSAFFKLDFKTLKERVKRVFCPDQYLEDKDVSERILHDLRSLVTSGKEIVWADLDYEANTKQLFKIWVTNYDPNLKFTPAEAGAEEPFVETDNPFQVLADASA